MTAARPRASRAELEQVFLHTIGWKRWDIQSRRVFDFLCAASASVSEDAVVVDVGAGESHCEAFFRHGRYIAVDFAKGDARWDYSRLHLIADVQSLPLADGCADLVLNVVVLEHVPRPDQLLREASRILRPGGRLILCAPMAAGEHQVPYDFFRYTRYGLTQLCEQAGLRVESVQGSNGPFYTGMKLTRNSLSSIENRFVRSLFKRIFDWVLLPLAERQFTRERKDDYPMLFLCAAVRTP
ncbi:MAG: class I SAM-dependent methyltransferase [Planctomycetota bacterium]